MYYPGSHFEGSLIFFKALYKNRNIWYVFLILKIFSRIFYYIKLFNNKRFQVFYFRIYKLLICSSFVSFIMTSIGCSLETGETVVVSVCVEAGLVVIDVKG